jgi:hypothetical protein
VSHLGPLVSALADGELAPDAAERALAHAAGCDRCAAAVEAERSTKALLSGAGAPPPSPDLLARLGRIGGPEGPLPARTPPMPGESAAGVEVVPWAPAAGSRSAAAPGHRRRARRRAAAHPTHGRPAGRGRRGAAARGRRSRVAAAVGGTLLMLSGGLAGAFALGAAPATPPVVPPVAQFRAAYDTATRDVPLRQPWGALSWSTALTPTMQSPAGR